MSEENSQVVTCSSCDREFIFYKCDDLSCPNCDAAIMDLLVSLGIGWMLGDWFGLWGDDD